MTVWDAVRASACRCRLRCHRGWKLPDEAALMWTRLFIGDADWRSVIVAVLPTALVAWMAGRWSRRGMSRVMRSVLGETLERTSPVGCAPIPLVRFAALV